MKGIVATRFGEPAEVLELKTLPDPQPPDPGEVVVRVTKRQLHPGNLAMIRGRFNIPLPAGGLVPGGDGVGVVEAVGAGVDSAQGVKPGARVIFNPSPGAWAERLKTRAELVTPIPGDLPDAIAAQLLPNTVIALLLLRAAQRAAPDAGREIPILLTAAGSAVARIVIDGRSPARLEGRGRGSQRSGCKGPVRAVSGYDRGFDGRSGLGRRSPPGRWRAAAASHHGSGRRSDGERSRRAARRQRRPAVLWRTRPRTHHVPIHWAGASRDHVQGRVVFALAAEPRRPNSAARTWRRRSRSAAPHPNSSKWRRTTIWPGLPTRSSTSNVRVATEQS